MRTPLQRKLGVTAPVCMAIVLALAAPATADTEPNDVISQAEGPIPGGPISGTLSSNEDVDYYVFYVEGQHGLHLTFNDLSLDGPYCVDAQLKEGNGVPVSQDETTGAGVNRYFVAISTSWTLLCNHATHPYSFQLDPSAAIVSGPAMDTALVATVEPNDSPDQAQGPLLGGVNYIGSAASSDDHDWFSFNVGRGTHRLDISVTKPFSDCDLDVEVSLYGGDTSSGLRSAKGDTGSFGHLTYLTGPGRYYLEANSHSLACAGASWQFRIDPAGALTPTPAPSAPTPAPPAVLPLRKPTPTSSLGPSRRCISATLSRTRWTRRWRRPSASSGMPAAHGRSARCGGDSPQSSARSGGFAIG